MRRRQRKLIGVIATLAFVTIYALIIMAVAQTEALKSAPEIVKWLYYIVFGMGWVLPLMPLIRWMERPDADAVSDY